MRTPWTIGIALALALGTVLWWRSGPGVESFEPTFSAPAPGRSQGVALVAPDATPPQTTASAIAASGAESELAGFYDDDVYAAIKREQARRGPGSWLRITTLILACNEFWNQVHRGGPALDPNTPTLGRQARAADLLARRCSQTNFDTLSDLMDVPVNDAHAQRANQALKELQVLGVDRPKVERAMRELIEQGSPRIPLSPSAPMVWRGDSWADRREEYRHAFIWAQRMATSLPGREGDDIRLLSQCHRYGHCEDRYDFGAHLLPPERYEAVKKLAYDMKDALQRKDVTPFLLAPK
jgi:hypothetical protein